MDVHPDTQPTAWRLVKWEVSRRLAPSNFEAPGGPKAKKGAVHRMASLKKFASIVKAINEQTTECCPPLTVISYQRADGMLVRMAQPERRQTESKTAKYDYHYDQCCLIHKNQDPPRYCATRLEIEQGRKKYADICALIDQGNLAAAPFSEGSL